MRLATFLVVALVATLFGGRKVGAQELIRSVPLAETDRFSVVTIPAPHDDLLFVVHVADVDGDTFLRTLTTDGENVTDEASTREGLGLVGATVPPGSHALCTLDVESALGCFPYDPESGTVDDTVANSIETSALSTFQLVSTAEEIYWLSATRNALWIASFDPETNEVDNSDNHLLAEICDEFPGFANDPEEDAEVWTMMTPDATRIVLISTSAAVDYAWLVILTRPVADEAWGCDFALHTDDSVFTPTNPRNFALSNAYLSYVSEAEDEEVYLSSVDLATLEFLDAETPLDMESRRWVAPELLSLTNELFITGRDESQFSSTLLDGTNVTTIDLDDIVHQIHDITHFSTYRTEGRRLYIGDSRNLHVFSVPVTEAEAEASGVMTLSGSLGATTIGIASAGGGLVAITALAAVFV